MTGAVIPTNGAADAPPPAPSLTARLRQAWRPALAVTLMLAWAVVVWWQWPEAASRLRWTLLICGAAIVAWTLLTVDETKVALVAGLALVATGALPAETLRATLGHQLIWLMLGAFVMAAAWQHSGLLQRWVAQAVCHARRMDHLLRGLTVGIAATALLVPSTSGRAALLLPVFLALVQVLPQPRLARALALLFASVILLSAGISLLGAGAHLVAVDALTRMRGPTLGFLDWFLLAGPFGLLSSLLACEVILRLFLTREERLQPVNVPAPPAQPLTRQQWAVLACQGLVVLVWCTTAWHAVDAATAALVGALVMTWRALTGLDLKQALKQVDWRLLLFLAATLGMSEALLDTGAAMALGQALLGVVSVHSWPPPAALAAICGFALMAHLVVTSRTARASVLIIVIALPLASTQLPASLLIFCVTLGSGFCQTLAASAKPVAVFAAQGATQARDWQLLSLALLLPLWALLWMFSLWVWPALGLR